MLCTEDLCGQWCDRAASQYFRFKHPKALYVLASIIVQLMYLSSPRLCLSNPLQETFRYKIELTQYTTLFNIIGTNTNLWNKRIA